MNNKDMGILFLFHFMLNDHIIYPIFCLQDSDDEAVPSKKAKVIVYPHKIVPKFIILFNRKRQSRRQKMVRMHTFIHFYLRIIQTMHIITAM